MALLGILDCLSSVEITTKLVSSISKREEWMYAKTRGHDGMIALIALGGLKKEGY